MSHGTDHGNDEFKTRHSVDGISFPTPQSDTFREEVLAILRELADRTSDDPSTLRKVSDDTYEAAVVLTEYYSPDQHGGLYGTVLRQYYAVPEVTAAATSATIDLGITVTGRIVKAEGMVELQAGDTFLPLPYVDPADAGDEGIGMVVTLDDIILTKNANDQDWKAGGFILVDYVM